MAAQGAVSMGRVNNSIAFATGGAFGTEAAPINGGELTVTSPSIVVELSSNAPPPSLTLTLPSAGTAGIVGTRGNIVLMERSVTGRVLSFDPRMRFITGAGAGGVVSTSAAPAAGGYALDTVDYYMPKPDVAICTYTRAFQHADIMLSQASSSSTHSWIQLDWLGTYSYVIVTWTGGTSGQITGSSYVAPSLSSNTAFTFTVTPFSAAGVAGTPLVVNAATSMPPPPSTKSLLSAGAASTIVAMYGLKLHNGDYAGPAVTVRRGTDNVTQSFYVNGTGTSIGTGILGTGTSLATWLSGATGFVTTWHDQSGFGRDMTQPTVELQPTIAQVGSKTHVYFLNKQTMQGPNVFAAATVTDMHWVSSTREVGRTQNMLFSLHGTSTAADHFFIHTPWTDGAYYFDAGDSSTKRVASTANLTSVGARVVLSAYKSSADNRNGMRINSGTRFLSSGAAGTAPVSGGVRINSFDSVGYDMNHIVYGIMIFSAKLASADEEAAEGAID